jgi:hypothetical protein
VRFKHITERVLQSTYRLSGSLWVESVSQFVRASIPSKPLLVKCSSPSGKIAVEPTKKQGLDSPPSSRTDEGNGACGDYVVESEMVIALGPLPESAPGEDI